MKQPFIRSLFWVFLFAAITSCKSEYEKIRTSNDATRIYDKSMEYYDLQEWQKAQSLMEIVLNRYKGTPKGEELYFKYANTFYQLNQFTSSAFHFETFSKNFPSSDKKEETDFLRAYSHYLLSPNLRLDQSYSIQAIDEMQLFVNTYPNSSKVELCNTLIDEMRAKMEQKAYNQGILYFEMRQYEAAVQAFQNVILDYPDTKNIEDIHWRMVESDFLLAENSVYDKKQDRFQNTIKACDVFLKKFPESAYASQVEKYKTIASQNIKNLIK